MVKKRIKGDHIPDKAELEIESNQQINLHEDLHTKTGRVSFPQVEEEYTDSSFKADLAQQAGRFSDQVLMDSPAAEAGTSGKDALDDIVAASKKKLAEKMNNKDK